MSSGTVNQEAKRIFAKLLATEDIMVRHDPSSQTASFDVDRRVLTLPVMNGMDGDICDLFVGHEVGHALFTPNMSEEKMLSILNSICKENIVIGKHVLNMVEDARIERMMRAKYPGIGKNFIRGYTNLLKNDFFGESVSNFQETNIIDRLNLWYKLGIYGILNLDMNDVENEFIQMMDSAKTFEDVVEISRKIVDHIRDTGDEQNLLEIEEDNQNVIEVRVEMKDGEKGEGESDNSQELGESDEDDESNDPEQNTEESQETRDTTTGDIAGISFTKKTTKPGKVSSGDALKNYVEKNARPSSDCFLYNALPTPNLSKIIVPWKDIHTEMQRIYAEHLEHEKGNIYFNPGPTYWSTPIAYNINSIFDEFDKECRASISGMTTAFKRKQQAYISRRTAVGKTGRIDMNSVHRFKFDDDLFLRSTFVPKGKNHGMIMYIDWSGSMSNNIRQTLEQAIYLAYFCRSINIPFRVYAFSDHPFMPYNKNEKYNDDRTNGYSFWNGGDRDKYGNLYAIPYNFHLFEFLSSDMNSKEFMNAVKNLLYISDMNAGKFSFYTSHSFCLGGTPLNEAVLSAIYVGREFKSKYNIQIMNTIFLTDGESGGRMVQYEPKSDHSYLDYYRKTNISFMFEGKSYSVENSSSSCVTNTLLRILRAEGNTRTIGFFLCSSQHITNNSCYYFSSENQTKKIQEFKKNSFVLCDHSAYDKYYLMLSNTTITTLDSVFDSINENADTRKIINSFVKSANNRNKGRILLNNFAETVAQDFN